MLNQIIHSSPPTASIIYFILSIISNRTEILNLCFYKYLEAENVFSKNKRNLWKIFGLTIFEMKSAKLH